jgi:hypothetical protein
MAQWYSDLAVEKAPTKREWITMVSLSESGEPGVKVFVFPGLTCIVALDPDPDMEWIIAEFSKHQQKLISEGSDMVH